MGLPKPKADGEKLPDSVWLQYKDIIHRLYIAENKPLSVVKQTMEDGHGFQPQRLCDYEVALRDVLHFRKNLKQEEWRAIGIHISERKRQAKESEVVWNNTPFEAKKVRKELLRNSRPKSGRTRNVNPALPQGLVIRTPPRSPATSAAVLLPSLKAKVEITAAHPTQDVDEGRDSQDNTSSTVHETIWEVQRALFEEGEFGVSPYRKLRGNLPFNRCMSRIVGLAQSHQLHLGIPSAEAWTPVTPRLFGANPSWELFGGQIYELSNDPLAYCWYPDSENIWFLKWVGVSADFMLLRSFFSINSPTAGAVYEGLIYNAGHLRMADLLKVLFALRPVLMPHNSTSIDDSEFIHAAVQMGSRSGKCLDILRGCLSKELPSSIAKRNDLKDPRRFPVLTAASRGDTAMLRLFVDAGWKAEPLSQQVSSDLIGEVMSSFFNLANQGDDDVTAYIRLLFQGGVLVDIVSSLCSDSRRPEVIAEASAIGCISWDELVTICPSMMRQTLQMAFMEFKADHKSGIDRARIFTVALHGANELRSYLEGQPENNSFLTRVILEECLLFAAVVNDWRTASGLLELGVDPHVGLLSSNLEQYQKGKFPWDPSIVAAAAGHLEVLSLLLSQIDFSHFVETAPIHELVQQKTQHNTRKDDVMGRELCRLGNLHRSYLRAQTRSSKLAGEDSLDDNGLCDALITGEKRFETLKYIRRMANSRGYGQKVDLEIIKAAVCRQRKPHPPRFECHLPCDILLMQGLIDSNLEYEEEGMDLLHLSIRNHCKLTVVRFLCERGFKVHSNPGGKAHNSMLHDALLSDSPDRSEIVEFLLLEGADCRLRGDGLTILEASLWNCSIRVSEGDEPSEYCRIFERLLDLGATAHQWPRKQLPKWLSLVELLLRTRASDDLILRVVDAGAPLNVCGYGSKYFFSSVTPLQAALHEGRESLARELIRRGADVHAPASSKGLTALQAACMGCLPIRFLEYLVVGLGVQVNEHPGAIRGHTSLAAAAWRGPLNTVEWLLEQGADINATSRAARSWSTVFPGDKNPLCRPLDLAVQSGSLDKVEFLLKAGGRSRKAGLCGAMDIAAGRGHYAIVSILRSWSEEHGRQMVEEEALYQRQNPEEAFMLTEATGDSYYSDSDDSEDGKNEDDSEIVGV